MRTSLKTILALGVMLAAPAVWGQKPPQAKSQKEVDAIMAFQKAQGADAQLKAIDYVLENFADTEFKLPLLLTATQIAEQKGDFAATLTYGERTLEVDPKNVIALSILATETVSHTREYDLDKEEKLTKADKYATHAIEYSKDAPKPRADVSDEQWNNVKKDISAQCHDALGRSQMLRKKYEAAIAEFKTAIDTGYTKDPTSMVRLGEAYLQDGKYDEAIHWLDEATTLPNATPQIKSVAAARKAEAVKLKAAPKPAGGTTPPGSNPN